MFFDGCEISLALAATGVWSGSLIRFCKLSLLLLHTTLPVTLLSRLFEVDVQHSFASFFVAET